MFGSLGFHLYGLFVGLGILVGFWVAARFAFQFEIRNSKFEISPDDVWGSLWWVVIPGVVFARIYHVLDLWDFYQYHLLLIPALWTGGMGIFGAIIGGVLGMWMYCFWMCSEELRALDRNMLDRNLTPVGRAEVGRFARLLSMVATNIRGRLRGLPGHWPGRSSLRSEASSPRAKFFLCARQRFLVFLDLVAFGLPIGQAVGRWGNFFNQELYGKPTALPWGLAIPLEKRLSGFEQYTHFQPLFLYESLWSLLMLGLLYLVLRKRGPGIKPGSYFAGYLVLYGMGRFFLEELRISPWMISGINVAQAMGILFIVSGGVILYSYTVK